MPVSRSGVRFFEYTTPSGPSGNFWPPVSGGRLPPSSDVRASTADPTWHSTQCAGPKTMYSPRLMTAGSVDALIAGSGTS